MPAEGFVPPRYGSASLADVVPAVAVALGESDALATTSLELPPAPAYVVFLVDGLGYEILRRHPAEAPFLSALLGEPATCGVPSTTATSLTSLGTGLPPGAHGVVGYTSRIPGTDRLLNALMWDKGVDPLEWQPHPTAFQTLARAGVRTTVVSKREFAGSGLTNASQRGAGYLGADRIGERLAGVVGASAEPRSLTYVYDGDLDWTGHRYGVDSPQWRAQLTAIDDAAEQMREALPPDVRLLVVADHGMIDSPADARIDIAAHPELRDGVRLVGGEARFRHLYCASGAVPDVVAAWGSALAGRADVFTRDEVVANGWFGDVEAFVRPRLGDVIVATRGDFSILHSEAFPYETRLIGMHGSLTADEMLIPMLLA